MRRAKIALGAIAAAAAVGVGVLAVENSPTSKDGTALESRLVASASSLPHGWSVVRGPTSMSELSVPAWYRCLLPPSPVFGDAIANEQLRFVADGEYLSETLGMATTRQADRAGRLLRLASLGTDRCLRTDPPRAPRARRTVRDAYFSAVQPFETGFSGWTGYAPPTPFSPPSVGLGTVLLSSGLRLGAHRSWLSYTVLSDGYVVEISANGRMTPKQVAAIVDRLASAL